MNKWYKFINAADGGKEIHIYGAIADKSNYWNDNTCPTGFKQELDACKNGPVTIRINSGGGSVFAAHAIYNTLKDYKGAKTVIVDGLVASAATVIALAGDKVIMPKNAVFMIHNPMICLNEACTASELTKTADVLNTIKTSIVNVYVAKTGLSNKEVEEMMDEETWMDADTALEKGFVDEIKGNGPELKMKGELLIVNSISHNVAGFKNVKNAIKSKEVSNAMDEKLEAILNKVGEFFASKSEVTNEVPTVDVEAVKNEAIKAERERVQALDALVVNDNPAINAIINAAKAEGKTAEEVKTFVDALKNVDLTTPAQKIQNDAKADAKDSGVDNVVAEPTAPTNTVDDAKELDAFVNILNSKLGGKK